MMNDGGEPNGEAALLTTSEYGEETFVGATVGGIMRIDDDTFRLGVVASNGDKAVLQVLHSTDTDLNKTVEVEFRTVFTVGDHRIRVVTVGDGAVAVRWAQAL